jgi:hypothetical protein
MRVGDGIVWCTGNTAVVEAEGMVAHRSQHGGNGCKVRLEGWRRVGGDRQRRWEELRQKEGQDSKLR